MPNGSVKNVELKHLKGLGSYEVTSEVTIKGEHTMSFLLDGKHISKSPVIFLVKADKPIAAKSRMIPPYETVINEPCEIVLETCDKYGNKLDRGGSRVDARANGPGISPCVSEDRGDGTYTITFTAAVPGESRLICRLENVEMAPLKFMFAKRE